MKGKQAALAANRRYESSIEHIDRLTTELVNAKERARQFEKEARSVPVLHGRIAELEEQVRTVTSEEVERLSGLARRYADRVGEAESLARSIQRKWERLTTRIVHLFGSGVTGIEELMTLIDGQQRFVIDNGGTGKQRVEVRLRIEVARGQRHRSDLDRWKAIAEKESEPAPALINGFPRVNGECSACGRSRLYLADGVIRCAEPACPNPCEVSEMLYRLTRWAAGESADLPDSSGPWENAEWAPMSLRAPEIGGPT
jgi:hypothetical protein